MFLRFGTTTATPRKIYLVARGADWTLRATLTIHPLLSPRTSSGIVRGRRGSGRRYVRGAFGGGVESLCGRDGSGSRGGVGGALDLGDCRISHQAELGRLERHERRGDPGVGTEALRSGVYFVRVEVVRAPGDCPLLALALRQRLCRFFGCRSRQKRGGSSSVCWQPACVAGRSSNLWTMQPLLRVHLESYK